MKTITKAMASIALGFCMSHNAAFGSPITGLYYTSAPDSWVGNGKTLVITPSDNFDFIPSSNPYHPSVSFAINDFSKNPDFWSMRWWNLDFAAPYNQRLDVGHYANATRYPFHAWGEPGLWFAGNGRGSNQITGSFDVLEIDYDVDGLLLSFAADFTQYDENIVAWWNKGSIRYNSNIALFPIPEPHMVGLFAIGLLGLAASVRRKQLPTKK